MQTDGGGFLARKLERFARLSPEDKAALDALARERVRQLAARAYLAREGDKPERVDLVLSGWACRHKVLEDGRRQILAFLLPGDLCDLDAPILRAMDHSISAITPVAAAGISRAAIGRVMERHPRVAQALLWDRLVAAATQREWTVNLGQRSALERVAHLLCELFLRLRAVGLAQGASCEFLPTQADLAEASGLTPVHVNRTLQELRRQGLIALEGRRLRVPDLAALQDAALFNPSYLARRGPRGRGREGRRPPRAMLTEAVFGGNT